MRQPWTNDEEREKYYRSTWGRIWTTDEATNEFTFEGFGGGLVAVTRKADGVRGSLNFTADYPRFYFDFMEA